MDELRCPKCKCDRQKMLEVTKTKHGVHVLCNLCAHDWVMPRDE